ncbi:MULTISPECIES: helix-turn-helix transcriptional regulator [unclassified Chromohalobacter]|uniref:helix-turn-helix domain-containing protein n=1 Tax=unclassified Chromohalobacter TaxID=2628571 RepID=UPI002469223D|nr:MULTISPECIES: helix-turn-helix transcriptional regulator [unclassified Chromohalobacter]
MQDDFLANLRLLCGYYPSIAEVCRRLHINRSQFNRYLSGRYRPRHAALQRICALFGVEEHELYLPQAEFRTLVQVGRDARAAAFEPPAEWPSALLARGQEGMARYLGCYFEYYRSMSRPGQVIRTLVCLETREQGTVYQRTERMQVRPGTRPCHNRYHGLAFRLADRIFLVDYETLNGNEITQTILFPSFQSQVHRLTGLKLGVADNSERMPNCVRVVYERLDEKMSVRRALEKCGLLSLDAPELDSELYDRLRNDIDPGEQHFRARH